MSQAPPHAIRPRAANPLPGFWLRFAARGLTRRGGRSVITLGAVSLGVAILTWVGAIMVGVTDAMIANSVTLHNGHLAVTGPDAAEQLRRWRNRPGLPASVRAALPRLRASAMIMHGSHTVAAQIVGVLPDRERSFAAVPGRIVRGAYLEAVAGPAVCLGAAAAERLGRDVGDTVTLAFNDRARMEARIAGVFRTGVDRLDESVAFVHADALPAAALPGAVAETALFLRTGADTDAALARIKALLNRDERAASWKQQSPELEQLIRLNMLSMVILIVLVVLMMAAGVSNTVLVSVMDRYRAFGILKAMGATPWEIVRLILLETALMCGAAGCAGLALGAGATLVSAAVGIDLGAFTSANPHFIMSGVIHPRLTVAMSALPPLAALAVCLAAALWPASIAARRRADEILRHAQ